MLWNVFGVCTVVTQIPNTSVVLATQPLNKS